VAVGGAIGGHLGASWLTRRTMRRGRGAIVLIGSLFLRDGVCGG
jgi:hypothetical protein